MKNLRTRVSFLSTLCFAVLYSVISSADARTPTEHVKLAIDNVLDILTNEELKKPEKIEEKRAAIRKIVDDKFDFEEMAKRSLARHWRDRTPQERKEFVSLYSDLLWKTYVNVVEKYENEKIEYVGETIKSTYALVQTKVVTKQHNEIEVDFRLFKKNGSWRAYDVKIQGVSLINNYRTQFNEIILSSSYMDLVRRIKDKVITAEFKTE